jgi:hypothetical protein
MTYCSENVDSPSKELHAEHHWGAWSTDGWCVTASPSSTSPARIATSQVVLTVVFTDVTQMLGVAFPDGRSVEFSNGNGGLSGSIDASTGLVTSSGRVPPITVTLG